MTDTRRDFLRSSVLLGLAGLAAPVLGRPAPRTSPPQDSKPAKRLKILVLGGTNFLGPKVVEAARARGHELTLFTRGRRGTDLFPEVERLLGDRDPKKGDGLKALEGRSWDAVIDHSGYYPRHVKASAELLAPRVGRCLFVSSISAYKDPTAAGLDETAPLAELADPTVETMGENYANYGGLKALCEAASAAAFPGRATIVRPTYIVGPGDPTDRFTYWPARFARGGEIAVPGTPDDPIQIIDVRDLAAWIVRLVEDGTTGAFNALGPTPPYAWGAVVAACERASAATKRSITWIPAEFMERFVKDDDDVTLPIWIAPKGRFRGMHAWNNARAVKAGLVQRPLDDVVKDVLAWWGSLPEARRAKLGAGLSPEKESEILAARRAR